MIIEDIKPFSGEHCEATATGTLLKYLNINLSEPMIFGLGESLSFFFWHMKSMDTPLFLGRNKPLQLTKKLSERLGLILKVSETSSITKAWQVVKANIDSNIPTGLKLDMYHLDYFNIQEHFPGHFVAIYGFDDKYAYLIDWKGFGSKVKTSLKSLEMARNAKGPMSSKNLSYTISNPTNNYNLENAIITATRNNAKEYLNPPIQNLGYKGIIKAGKELKKCLSDNNCKWDSISIADFIEEAGTGGAIFRNFYRDYLKESYEIVQKEEFFNGYTRFIEIASLWTEFSSTLKKIGQNREISLISFSSQLLFEIAEKEKQAMEILETI
jgi:hypothetical protein